MALSVAMCVAGPSRASACSMPSDYSIQNEFNDARLVFRGLVTQADLNPLEFDSGGVKERSLVDVRYEVAEIFKGKPQPSGIISTHTGILGGCGVPIMVGQQYLFFVVPFESDFITSEPQFADQSQGMISNLSSQMLMGDAARMDETLAEVRALATAR